MKTIREKLSKPFLTIILVIPLVTMLLFNVAMSYYANRSAEKELQNTVSGIEILIKQQLIAGFMGKNQHENLATATENLKTLRGALRLTKLSMNTEFLVISASEEVLFPLTYEDSFLNEKIVSLANAILLNASESETMVFRIGRNKYFTTFKELTKGARSSKLIFISSGNSISQMIKIINMILISIMFLAAGIGSIIVLKISKTLSRPITRLSEYAKQIGEGDFLSLPEDNSSVEVHALTNNMNEMSERLKNNDQIQKNFLQNASHELRTPLMSIQGYAEGIAKGIFSDTSKTAEIICEESIRLNTLVEELLTLSRIENKTYRGEFVSLNLSDMMKEYVQKINGYAIKEGKTLRLNILNETVTAKIDDTLLAQAMINIISNCIKYAKNEVVVTVLNDRNQPVIQISDDGNGIDSIDLPHIFDRFYKGKKGNFGLGLSIAKSAIEFMGGNITAYNRAGAVFEIELNV